MCKPKFYKTLIGYFIILFIIYRCLILERTSYEINNQIPYFTRVIIICVILTHFLDIKNMLSSSKSDFREMLLKIIDKFYFKPLQIIRDKCLSYTKINDLIMIFSGVLNHISFDVYFIQFYTISILLAPRALLSYTLYLDIYLSNQIKIFYNFLWLIMLPLIFYAVLALLKEYHIREKQFIEENHLLLEEKQIMILFKPKNNLYDFNYINHVNRWENIMHRLDLLTAIDLVKKTKSYLVIYFLLHLIFIFLWSYYLYKIYTYSDDPITPNYLYIFLILIPCFLKL